LGGWGYADALAEAQQLMAGAGYPEGEGFDIVLMHNVSEGHARIAQAIQAMWTEAFPKARFIVETMEWKVYLKAIQKESPLADMPHVFRLGWCLDYPDENNWIHEVMNPEEGANRFRLSYDDPYVGDLIEEFSALTMQAGAEADPDDRKALYKRAEKLASDDIAFYAPIYYYTTVNLTKPYVVRTFATLGGEHWEKWDIIAEQPKVLHESTVILPVLGRQFEVRKVMDLASGCGHEIAVDEEGALIEDLDSILVDEEKAYFERYEKVHPTLYEAIEEASAEAPIPVALWVLVEEDDVDKSEFDTELLEQNLELLLAYREQNHEAQEGVIDRLHDALGITRVEASDTAPVLYLELIPDEIEEVARWEEVAGLFLHETEGIDDLSNSMRDSNASNVIDTQGWRATNIRVGVWEPGPDVLANLIVAAHYDATRSATSQHARLVTAIIKNVELGKPHGYAPDALVYSANNYTQKAIEWVVTGKECRVINQSFHRKSEAGSGVLSLDDIFKDYLVLHYPYPTIVQAAGNYWAGDSDKITPPKNEYVNHKGYNSLSVGNHDDNVVAMSGSSVFRNPTSLHGDRELPELCGNGTCVSAAGLMMNGTSFASPAVAGSAALLQNMNNTLLYWPEGNRAILLAGAGRNVSGKSWIQDLLGSRDSSDGSGALDIDESGRIALSRQGRNNAATMRGWDVGTLHQSDFDSKGNSTFSYRVQVPTTGSRRRVKVALTWNSKVTTKLSGGVTTYLSSRLTLDYDLHIYDGNRLVAHSSSWDNSYEIAEFTAEPGKVYTIKIRKWSGTGWSWYGIAWTVH
jgi:hypothetical protein